jgi:hypothetical protein
MTDSNDSNDGVSLSVAYSEFPSDDRGIAYALRCEVVKAEGIPPEVFVFHRFGRVMSTGFPWDMEIVDEFQNVATPVDVEETVPESLAGDNTRHFRSSSVEIVFRSPGDRERAKAAIDADVRALVRSWRELAGRGSENSETRSY